MSLSTPTPRELITRYHTLQKQLASLPYNASFPTSAARQAQANLLKAQLAQIPLPKYQQASLQGESHKSFDVTTWVLSNLPSGNRILDVGSIVHRFPDIVDGRQLDVTSIDLHSADERVTKIDFFEFTTDNRFDAVVLSLCVNFVGCPRKRGLMIYKAAGLLKRRAILFLVLPAACVKNSRYCDEHVLRDVLEACGLEVVHISYETKLCMAIARKLDDPEESFRGRAVKRRLVRGGRERNNFSIVVEHDGGNGGRAESLKRRASANDKGKMKGRVNGRVKRESGGMKGPGNNGGIAKTTSNQRRRARRQAKRAQKLSAGAG